MLSEDSAVEKLDDVLSREESEYAFLDAEKICESEYTRKKINKIIFLYKRNPHLISSYNFIVETRETISDIYDGIIAFTYTDGEGKDELDNPKDTNILNIFTHYDKTIENHVLSRIGQRVEK